MFRFYYWLIVTATAPTMQTCCDAEAICYAVACGHLLHATYRHAWYGKVFTEPSRLLMKEVVATLDSRKAL